MALDPDHLATIDGLDPASTARRGLNCPLVWRALSCRPRLRRILVAVTCALLQRATPFQVGRRDFGAWCR